MCPGSTSINSVNFSFDFIGRQIFVILYQAVPITCYGLSNVNVVAKVVPGQVPTSLKVDRQDHLRQPQWPGGFGHPLSG